MILKLTSCLSNLRLRLKIAAYKKTHLTFGFELLSRIGWPGISHNFKLITWISLKMVFKWGGYWLGLSRDIANNAKYPLLSKAWRRLSKLLTLNVTFQTFFNWDSLHMAKQPLSDMQLQEKEGWGKWKAWRKFVENKLKDNFARKKLLI